MRPPNAPHVIDKARKLLQLRERAASAGEAAAAAKALAKLLDKHRLDVAELELDSKQQPEGIVADDKRPLASWKRIEPWRRDLALVLAEHFGVCCWQQGLRRPGQAIEHHLCLCGRSSDVELVRGMYHWLGAELVRLCASACHSKGARYARSWRDGFVTGISRQLHAARGEIAQTNTQAIVLYDRAREAREHLLGLFGKLKPVQWSAHNEVDRQAYFQGRDRGDALHLGERIDSPPQQEMRWDDK